MARQKLFCVGGAYLISAVTQTTHQGGGGVEKRGKSVDKMYEKMMITDDNFFAKKTVKIITL